MPAIQLQNLGKNFSGEVTAVKDLSLDIKDGEMLVLMGPSGCGKSTTLRIIAGLEDATKGEVLVDGNDISKLHPGKRNIGMVFQNYALYPHKNIFNNLAFGMTIRKTPRKEIEKEVAEVARRLNIDTLLKRYPDQLSCGQKQRVALGRALLRGTGLLLFDEPLSNLDAKLRQQLRIEIAALHREKKFTGIFVTHDQTEAMTLADRIAVMNEGALIQVGTPEKIYNKPADMFVASFTGSPPMNIFEGAADEKQFVNELFSIEACEKTHNIGIRPEDIQPGEGNVTFEADVIQPELNGMDWIIHAGKGNVRFSCRSPRSLQPGTTEQFSLNPKKVHCFDRLGKRIG